MAFILRGERRMGGGEVRRLGEKGDGRRGVVWLRRRGPAVETDPSTVEAGGAGRWTA
jgi:hypothetical protein